VTVYTLTAGMPAIVVDSGTYLRLEAFDPATGAAVTGVTATAWAIYGDDTSALPERDHGDTVGPFMLVPGPDSAVV
jgi:hypothetical protein